jgi:chloramphenicol 3-O-phosphotransferase
MHLGALNVLTIFEKLNSAQSRQAERVHEEIVYDLELDMLAMMPEEVA